MQSQMYGRPHEAKSSRPQAWLGHSGAAAGLLGVLASSCCALPILLMGLGLGSAAGSAVPVLFAWRVPVLALATTFLAAAWWMYWKKRRACAQELSCERPQRMAWPLGLMASSCIVLLALAWPIWIEPLAMRWVRQWMQ